MNVLRAEFIKFRSVASSFWVLFAGLLIALGLAALVGANFEMFVGMAPGGKQGFVVGQVFTNLPVLFIWIALLVFNSGDFRHGTLRAALMRRPRRWDLYLIKTVFALLLTGVVSIVMMVLALIIVSLWAKQDGVAPWHGDMLPVIGKATVFAMIGAVLALGLSAILRNAAGAITLIVAWYAVAENILGIIPKVRDAVGKFLPFNDGLKWATDTGLEISMGSPGNVLWYLFIAAVFWLLGLVLLLKRDA